MEHFEPIPGTKWTFLPRLHGIVYQGTHETLCQKHMDYHTRNAWNTIPGTRGTLSIQKKSNQQKFDEKNF